MHGVQDVRHEDLVLVCIEQTQFCIPHGKACALDLCVVEDKNPEALGHMKAGIVRGGPPSQLVVIERLVGAGRVVVAVEVGAP